MEDKHHFRKIAFVVAISLAAVNHSTAAEVRPLKQVHYVDSKVVSGVPADSELSICDNCQPREKLKLADKKPLWVARVSESPSSQDVMEVNTYPVEDLSAQKYVEAMVLATPKLLDTVHFGLDSTKITKQQATRIKRVVSMLKDISSVSAVQVKGFTCDLGSQQHNDKLAADRANAVGKLLKDAGVAHVEISSQGECCYVSKIRGENRRVEISYTQGGTHD